MAVYSAWDYIDYTGKRIRRNNIRKKHKIAENKEFSFLGCSICIRGMVFDILTPDVFRLCRFQSTDWLLQRICSAAGTILFTDQVLFYRRIHSQNISVSFGQLQENEQVFYAGCAKENYKILNKQWQTAVYLLSVLMKEKNKYVLEELKKEKRYLFSRIAFVLGKIAFLYYWFEIINYCGFREGRKLVNKDKKMKKYMDKLNYSYNMKWLFYE